MSDKIEKIEEKIKKRKTKIQKLEDDLRKEKQLLKKDEKILEHVKYDELLKKLMKNNIAAEDIMSKVEEVIEEKETQSLENEEKAQSTNLGDNNISNGNK